MNLSASIQKVDITLSCELTKVINSKILTLSACGPTYRTTKNYKSYNKISKIFTNKSCNGLLKWCNGVYAQVQP